MATRKAYSPNEIRKILEGMDAKIREKDTGILVYPKPDALTTAPVTVPGRIRGGNELPNILAQLKRAGYDLDAPTLEKQEPSPVPTPAQMPAKMQVNGARPTPVFTKVSEPDTRFQEMIDRHTQPTPDAPADDRDELLGMLAEAEGRIRTLETKLDSAGQNISFLAEQNARLAEQVSRALDWAEGLDERLQAVENATPGMPKSNMQIVRELVLAFLREQPGRKWSPQLIEVNLEGLPDGLGNTAVGNACGELAEAGSIRGGAAQGFRGIYWYEAPSAP